MFNNRTTRRRFRLGNLARLVQLRQSVSHQPQEPAPPPKILQETLSQSAQQSPPFHPQPPQPPLPKALQKTLSQLPPQSPPFQPQPPKPESPSFQPHLPPPEAKTPPSLPSTPNANEEFQSQPSKFIDETLFQSRPASQASPPLLSESGESQPPLPRPESKIPQSTLNATKESQSQPPSLLPPSKAIDETRLQSSPPSLSESDEYKPPLPPTEAKIPPSTLNNTEESPPQPLLPSKFIDETLSQTSTPPSPPTSPQQPSKSTVEPKSTPPLPESRSQTHTLPPPSKLLSPKAGEILQSQSLISPPSPAKITAPPPKPSLPETEPNPVEPPFPKLTNTEPHTSPDHNKDQNHNPEKPDAELMKIPAENEDRKTEITGKVNTKKRGKASWSEKINPTPMMMMFVNSNVQGISTSLSLDSSSIDHEPGVHLTIDYDQSCDFSSTLF